MANDKKDKKDKGNGAPQAEQANVEQQLAGDGSAEVLPAAQTGDTAATDAPQEPPGIVLGGPEDFERHSGARLQEDHAADLRLQDEVESRLRKRGDVIAKRLRKNGVNATVEINGVEYVARQRPRCPGEMMLSEVPKLVKSTLDI